MKQACLKCDFYLKQQLYMTETKRLPRSVPVMKSLLLFAEHVQTRPLGLNDAHACSSDVGFITAAH